MSASNQLAGTEKSSATLADRGVAQTEMSGMPFNAKTGLILSRTGRVLAWHWYWVDGLATANDLRAKFQQLLVRLRGVHTTSSWVVIYTNANVSSDLSSQALQQFMTEMGGALEAGLMDAVNR